VHYSPSIEATDHVKIQPRYNLFIGGKFVEPHSKRWFETINPATEETLSEMAEADAKRLVDFAAGLAFGLRGSMERVTNRVFLLSPANVQVTAEDKARIAEGGFFNQS